MLLKKYPTYSATPGHYQFLDFARCFYLGTLQQEFKMQVDRIPIVFLFLLALVNSQNPQQYCKFLEQNKMKIFYEMTAIINMEDKKNNIK